MTTLIYLPDNMTVDTAVKVLTEDPVLLEMGLSPEKAYECLFSFQGNILAATVFLKKYALQDNDGKLKESSIEQSKNRWAKCISANEKEPDKWFLRYRELYDYFLPAGRQMYGLGNPYVNNLTFSNCYADGILEDNLEEIFQTAYRIAKTYAYGGGQGINISVLRPAKAKVSNSAKHSTGAASFVDLYSSITGIIGQHGRRGALIVLCRIDHPDIEIFINLKKEESIAEFANLSVLITDEFMKALATNDKFNLSFQTKHEVINQDVLAKNLWNSITESTWQSGDPGILFWDTVKRYSPSEIYPELQIQSTNPCFSKDTWIFTSDGPKLVEDLIGKECLVRVNDKFYRTSKEGFFNTGTKQLYKIITKEGYILRVTNNHLLSFVNKINRDRIETEWKEVRYLKSGDSLLLNSISSESWKGDRDLNYNHGYIIGFMLGDGTLSNKKGVLNVWEIENESSKAIIKEVLKCIDGAKLTHRSDFAGWFNISGRDEKGLALKSIATLANHLGMCQHNKNITEEIEKCGSDFYIGFLRGLFDADGSVQGDLVKGISVRLSQSDMKCLEAVQRMLLRLGIVSTIYKNRREAGFKSLPDGKGGEKDYFCKAQHELIISNDNIVKFANIINFIHSKKKNLLNGLISQYKRKPNKERFIVEIEQIVPDVEEKVYDVYVEEVHMVDANGFLAHNCGEQPLEIFGNCCLGSLLLHQFVRDPFTSQASFDFNLFQYMTVLAVRHLDNVVDIGMERHPLPEQREKARLGRRIGLGITGLADCLAALGIRYDSEAALEFIDRVMEKKFHTEHLASIGLAEEKGAFPLCDKEKHYDQLFTCQLPEEIKVFGRKYGQRNVALSTVAPNGSLSLIAHCSSGCEPVYEREHIRSVFLGAQEKQYPVVHPGLIRAKKTGLSNPEYYFPSASEIDYFRRIHIQSRLQQKTDAAISSCLDVDNNLLLTNEGLLYLNELPLSKNVKSFQTIPFEIYSYNNQNQYAKIDQTYNNGIEKVVNIKCLNGYEIKCTPNHKLEVLDNNYQKQWKEASALKKGDFIIGRCGLRLWRTGTKIQLNELAGKPFIYTRKTNSKSIKRPTRMSRDLARLLGYLCSDGSICVNGIALSQTYNNVCYDFERIVKKLFNIECLWSKDERAEDLWSIVANSRELSRFFQWLGITGHDNIEVPLIIRKSGPLYIKEFIRGATLDGFVSKNKISISTSISKKYLQQIQQILLNMGIITCLCRSNEEGERKFPSGKVYKTKKSWDLFAIGPEATKFLKYIGFAEDRKTEESNQKIEKKKYRKKLHGTIPDYGLRLRFRKECLPKLKSSLTDHFHSITSVASRKRKEIDRETILEMVDVGFNVPEILTDETYTFFKVKTIEDGGYVPTGDVSVLVENSYIVNGMVSHNTINLPETATKELISDLYTEAWRSGLKGITIFRDKCKKGVLSKVDKKEDKPTNTPTPDARRAGCPLRTPDTICYEFLAEGGDKFYIKVSYRDGDIKKPYQIFATNYKATEHDRFVKLSNDIRKMVQEKGVAEIALKEGETTESKIEKQAERSRNTLEKITRFASLALKSGYLEDLLKILEKHGFVGTLAARLYNILCVSNEGMVHTCKACGSENVVFENGCRHCRDCGVEMCGG